MNAQAMKTYADVTEFHGHSCMGTALGYRVALKAAEWLNANRSEDEEIVAVVENDSCAVDAIQVVTGCTFGKGNLLFRDIGKRGYTFYNRATGKGVRIVENYRPFESQQLKELRNAVFGGTATEEQLKAFHDYSHRGVDDILRASEEELFILKEVTGPPPPRARLFQTLTCECCGEKVMETRASIVNGKAYCADCGRNTD